MTKAADDASTDDTRLLGKLNGLVRADRERAVTTSNSELRRLFSELGSWIDRGDPDAGRVRRIQNEGCRRMENAPDGTAVDAPAAALCTMAKLAREFAQG